MPDALPDVFVYAFNEEAGARTTFDSLGICRILYDPSGEEVGHRGGNFLAFRTIRRHIRDRAPPANNM